MIFNAFERSVAFRYLRARRKEGFVSVTAGFALVGIALGVGVLIVVMAVMNGFRQDLLERILGVNGHLTVYGTGGNISGYEEVVETVSAVEGVTIADPQIQGQVMVTSGTSATGGILRGMTPRDVRGRELLAENIVRGDLGDFGDGEIMIGSRMARSLGLSANDQITLVAPKGRVTVVGTMPRFKTYKLAALFEVGMFEYDSSFIYMPLADAQSFLQLGDKVNAIEVFVEDPNRVDRVRRDIEQALGPDFRTVDWQRANSSFFNAIQVERNVMFLILTLIILVAAFNIISGQIMLVKDKRSAIAILRTMGATRGMILRVFLLIGASIGFIGTFLGFVLGIAFADNIEVIRGWLQALTGAELFAAEIYFLSQLPAEIDPGEVVAVVLMALGLTLLFALIPAWRAARIDPVEALRYE